MLNISSIRIVGLVLLASCPFLIKDYLSGSLDNLFSKTSSVAAICALIVSISNEILSSKNNKKSHVKNILELRLDKIISSIDRITFEYKLGVFSFGFRSFRIAMGDFQNNGLILNTKNCSYFAFWDSLHVLSLVDNILNYLIENKESLEESYPDTRKYILENINPIIQIYQSFYNQYLILKIKLGNSNINADLDKNMTLILNQMNSIGKLLNILKKGDDSMS